MPRGGAECAGRKRRAGQGLGCPKRRFSLHCCKATDNKQQTNNKQQQSHGHRLPIGLLSHSSPAAPLRRSWDPHATPADGAGVAAHGADEMMSCNVRPGGAAHAQRPCSTYAVGRRGGQRCERRSRRPTSEGAGLRRSRRPTSAAAAEAGPSTSATAATDGPQNTAAAAHIAAFQLPRNRCFWRAALTFSAAYVGRRALTACPCARIAGMACTTPLGACW